MNQSPKGTLSSYDWMRAGRALLMVLAGTAATFLVDQIPSLDFGAYNVLVVAVFTFVADVLERFAAGTPAAGAEPDDGGGK